MGFKRFRPENEVRTAYRLLCPRHVIALETDTYAPCAKPTKEYALYHRLIEIRREHAAFSEGGMQFLYAKGKTLAIARQDAAHTFVALISSEEIPSPSWESGSRTQKWTFWENPSTLREQKKASCSLFRRRMPFCFRADDIWL